MITIIFAFFKVRTLWQNEDIIETLTVTAQCLKSTEKVVFNIYILSGQKFIKNANVYLLYGRGVKHQIFFKRSKIFFLMPEINENLLR